MSRSKKFILFAFVVGVFCRVLEGCIGAGTHGSIRAYQYPVPKAVLQAAVEKIIGHSKNIYADTIINYNIDVTDGKNDTIFDHLLNDTIHYRTFTIFDKSYRNEYVVHYTNSPKEWAINKFSEISIAYAWSKDKGGSEVEGLEWYRFTLKRKLLGVFESQFTAKLDEELKQKHTIK